MGGCKIHQKHREAHALSYQRVKEAANAHYLFHDWIAHCDYVEVVDWVTGARQAISGLSGLDINAFATMFHYPRLHVVRWERMGAHTRRRCYKSANKPEFAGFDGARHHVVRDNKQQDGKHKCKIGIGVKQLQCRS
jgi:hypothetical protein